LSEQTKPCSRTGDEEDVDDEDEEEDDEDESSDEEEDDSLEGAANANRRTLEAQNRLQSSKQIRVAVENLSKSAKEKIMKHSAHIRFGALATTTIQGDIELHDVTGTQRGSMTNMPGHTVLGNRVFKLVHLQKRVTVGANRQTDQI
jgi:hypothetical protein